MIETEAWLLPRNQHDSEASFVSHHPSVSFGSICQRNGFDHRTDLLQGAKGKRVLGIYRRAGHRSRKGTIPNRSVTGSTLIGYNRIPLRKRVVAWKALWYGSDMSTLAEIEAAADALTP